MSFRHLFPRFSSPAHIRCFQCGRLIGDEKIRDHHNEVDEGRFSVACPDCDMRTWFDFGAPAAVES